MRLRPLFCALALVVLGILAAPLFAHQPLIFDSLALASAVVGVAFLRRPALATSLLLLPFLLFAVGQTQRTLQPDALTLLAGALPDSERQSGNRAGADAAGWSALRLG